MCGICGYIDKKNSIEDSVLKSMVKAIEHRGPDDNGIAFFQAQEFKIGLGHARLAILDLSKAGHQPMEYGELTIVYNGEIYNFKEIRRELDAKGHTFHSETDTEVILHAFKEWGTTCVERFIGMFVFAIFDNNEQKLYMCRDRAGVKPLYYHYDRGLFAFASELKAFMAMPMFKREISMEALCFFLKRGQIPNQQCIFEKTYKLEGGCWLVYDINKDEMSETRYWDVQNYYALPKLDITYEDAKAELKRLFKSAFGYRLVSDVPVAVLLSSGFDSTAVSAIMVKELDIIPQTFTLGFSDGVDEVPDAECIAKTLGTHHVSAYCTENDLTSMVEKLPEVYDEPFGDISALPTLLLSQEVKKHASVALSAEGGDELFCGYGRYDNMLVVYERLKKSPLWLHHFIKMPYHLSRLLIPAGNLKEHAHLEILNGILSASRLSYKAVYDNRRLYYQTIFDELNHDLRKYDCRMPVSNIYTSADSPEYACLSDFVTIMKDEYLVKIDRAMMSVSLEGREPMLDHRIVEFAAQLPWEYKYKNGIKKRILKDIVYDYLPKELMDKPKKGFSPPIGKWMRGVFKESIYDTLSESNLKEIGFDFSKSRTLLDKFMKGEDYCDYYCLSIWRLYQYLRWYNKAIMQNHTI